MNVILTIVIKTICSFFGTVAFGKIFNCPKHCLYKAGFVGAVGLASTSFSSAVLASVPCSAILLEP